MPCSKGKTDEHGKRCPYAETEPQTMEGWQAWDVALCCSGQLRMAQFVAVGIDMNAALNIANALGYDTASVAELLPSCEVGMITAINEKLSNSVK